MGWILGIGVALEAEGNYWSNESQCIFEHDLPQLGKGRTIFVASSISRAKVGKEI
jgi:hypothetical protein